MCFSARVKQKFDHLSRHHGAEVDWDAFEDVFKRRAEGEDLKVARDLQRNYQNPVTDVQKRTAGYIAEHLRTKKAEWENEVFVQRRRLAAAEESLSKEVVKRNEPHKFQVLSKRWIVERTFAWLAWSRRLSKDYELRHDSAETMIHIAFAHQLLRRLT